MRSKIIVSLILLMPLSSYAYSSDDSEYQRSALTGYGQDKIKICHITKSRGKTIKKETIVVSVSAAKAHLAHGDYLGTCQNIEPHDKDHQDNRDEGHDDKKDKNGRIDYNDKKDNNYNNRC